MLYTQDLATVDTLRQSIRDTYRADETGVIAKLLGADQLNAVDRANIWQRTRQLVLSIREQQQGKGGVDALLQEFSLSTGEGIVLMCLAEALLRVPDKHTMDNLIRDKLAGGDWDHHLGNSDSLFVNASAWGLLLTGKMVNYSDENKRDQFGVLKKTMGRVGEPVIRKAVRYAMQVMGTQFVLGTTINEALKRADVQEARGYRYSYDMLGEGARTDADALRYFDSYMSAIESIGKAAKGRGSIESPGISVKLSAIHARYEFSHRDRVLDELLPRLKALVLAAKKYDIGFTVDAEEADRLDFSMDIIEAIYLDPELEGWEGFGLAVQAYQKRASLIIDWLVDLSRRGGRKIMVRLVKGAYWDSEIKWSQEEGLPDYPVFTRKASTDVSYQVCAQKLLAAREFIYPQFATHNAYTVASILELDKTRQGYEFQRLHGMGDALYDQIVEAEGVSCRIYAPVGEHADLLAYLVRRLLENGANSSFVNNIVDESVPVESLLVDPVTQVRGWELKFNSFIPKPQDIYGKEFEVPRKNSAGADLSDLNVLTPMKAAMEGLVESWLQAQPSAPSTDEIDVLNPAKREQVIGRLTFDTAESLETKLQAAQQAFGPWQQRPVAERARLLEALADALEENRDELLALCIKEAGKILPDAVAEVREAVDFCRYYAKQAELLMAKPELAARGTALCISPWNFPLAIFLGQVSAAVVCGNTVLAKAAEQTSLVAQKAVALMHQVGIPVDVVQLLLGPGKAIGEQLVPDARIAAVMFTGSTATGLWINQTLAQREDNNIPLIAETGGQNAMIVDSTALPEQVVDDVISSGFQSAGQRCSALRVLFLQEDVADKIITMIKGAMAELSLGDPQWLSADVGPVIDAPALERLQAHQQTMASLGKKAQLHHVCEIPKDLDQGYYFAPHLYEISSLDLLKQEVFGPVVHIVRFKAKQLGDVIEQINRAGFGLTLGVHSRNQSVCNMVAAKARVGNVYINRNIIGAVVGVQPFGGRGLSGTGPKAGGPHYLESLVKQVTETAGHETDLELGSKITTSNLKAATSQKSDKGHAVREQWQALAAEVRHNRLRRFVNSLSQVPGVEDLSTVISLCQQQLDALCKLQDSQLLPGPTGEMNMLSYDARGLLLAVINSDNELAVSVASLVAALAAGSSLRVVDLASKPLLLSSLLEKLAFADIPAEVLQVCKPEQLTQELSKANLDGVFCAGHNAPLKRLLSRRPGAITPLLDSGGAFYLSRLLVEKTASNNTTAAGGNASLMSMSED